MADISSDVETAVNRSFEVPGTSTSKASGQVPGQPRMRHFTPPTGRSRFPFPLFPPRAVRRPASLDPDARLVRPTPNLRATTCLIATILTLLFGAGTAQAQTAPTVTGVAITSDSGNDLIYAEGDVIEATVTFSASVDVTGTPQLKIRLNAAHPDTNLKTMIYVRGNGTAKLVFAYTVVSGNTSKNPGQPTDKGIGLPANQLALSSGTIKAAGGTANAVLAYSAVGHDADHKVDASSSGPQQDDLPRHAQSPAGLLDQPSHEVLAPAPEAVAISRTLRPSAAAPRSSSRTAKGRARLRPAACRCRAQCTGDSCRSMVEALTICLSICVTPAILQGGRGLRCVHVLRGAGPRIGPAQAGRLPVSGQGTAAVRRSWGRFARLGRIQDLGVHQQHGLRCAQAGMHRRGDTA